MKKAIVTMMVGFSIDPEAAQPPWAFRQRPSCADQANFSQARAIIHRAV